MNREISEIINISRFPLIVCVLFIHNILSPYILADKYYENMSLSFLVNVESVIGNIIARVAVPAFFIISGYLFFDQTVDKRSYKIKMKKRIKTLLLPMVSWNLLYSLLLLLALTLGVGIYANDHEFSVLKYIGYLFINPVAYQFWFIRDLLIVMIFSPLIYQILKSKNVKYYLMMFWCLWIFDSIILPDEVQAASLCFFSFGGYLRVYKVNVLNYISFSAPAFIYLVLIVLDFSTKHEEYNFIISKVTVVVGIISFFCLMNIFRKKSILKNNVVLANFSFFLYAAHEPILLSQSVKYVVSIHLLNSEYQFVILYFIRIILLIILLLCVYTFLKRCNLKFISVLMGGR